ncbi:MAG TPA: YceI family protein, partial [Oleiagrimonas sp.]|nr:YceI family protein [Oleiagrimonas sp.]
ATELDIDLGSADMGDAEWNRAVRGRNFLDAAHDRLAHFKSTSVEKTSERSGILHGELTLRGVTRMVNIAFTINRVGRTIFGMHRVAGFSARATLIRDAFGMRRFAGSVGHKVALRLEIEAIADADARRQYQQRHPQVDADAAEK